MRPSAVLAVAVAVAVPGLVRAAPVVGDPTLVPGLMGYNALPAMPAADPVVADELELEVSAAAQASDLGSATDASALPYLRLLLPFRRVVALEIDAIPFEVWRVGTATQQRLDAVHASGVVKGDVRLAARFTLVREGAVPAIGLRIFTKTATGKGAEDRRFLNAPAYGGDALLGKTLPWALGPFEVRALAALGFLAWQQGSGRQDDAVTAAASLQLRSAREVRVALDARAYWGYQGLDKPLVIGLTGARRVTPAVELLATAERGFGDAPPWAAKLGVVIHVAARELPIVGETLGGEP